MRSELAGPTSSSPLKYPFRSIESCRAAVDYTLISPKIYCWKALIEYITVTVGHYDHEGDCSHVSRSDASNGVEAVLRFRSPSGPVRSLLTPPRCWYIFQCPVIFCCMTVVNHIDLWPPSCSRLICTHQIELPSRNLMWIPDWLRRIRSVRALPVAPNSRDDTAIANQQSALRNDGSDVFAHDDETHDFVIILKGQCSQPSDSGNASCNETTSIGTSLRSHLQQPAEDYDEIFTHRESAHLLELCGRGDHDHTFQDLRSASRARKRDKTTRQKYYNFKHVDRGDFEALHRQSVDTYNADYATLPEANKIITTKSELYRQAQLPPRPPKYHRRHIDKIYGTISHRVDIRREDRKHNKAMMKDHLRDL
jgi:hypothetical protein